MWPHQVLQMEGKFQFLLFKTLSRWGRDLCGYKSRQWGSWSAFLWCIIKTRWWWDTQSQFAAGLNLWLCDFWKCHWKRVRLGKVRLNGKVKSLRSPEMEKLRLLWLWLLMDIKAFHRPQLMAWLKIQMWDRGFMLIFIILHVNTFWLRSPYFSFIILHVESMGKTIYVKLTGLLDFLSWDWLCVCGGKHLRQVWRCLAAILLYSHSCHCWDLVPSVLFPSGVAMLQMWSLREPWMIKLFTAFCFPVVYMNDCSICLFCESTLCFCYLFLSLPKFSWQTPFCLSFWKREESKQTQDSCWLAWQQRSPSSSVFINFVAVWINLSAACCQLIIKKVKMSAR